MEVASPSLAQRLQNLFLKDPIPFSTRREVNWRAIKKGIGGLIVLAVVALLLLPESKPQQATYQEKAETGSVQNSIAEGNPSATAANQFDQSRSAVGGVPRNLDYLYDRGNSGGGSSASGRDRNGSMIVTRGGVDSKTQVPPGSRIRVKLLETAIVAGTSIPVIGLVAQDFIHEDGLAIPKGSKIFGEVSFDESSDRGQFSWRSIQLPDGRDRQFSAVSVDCDGQVGVQGKIHSEALKNTAGQTLTRFVAAYAEGSMQRGALGSNPGGDDNGWKHAVAETAKDRADAWAEDLKKEKKWIELRSGTEFFAVLKEPFTFRDPGGSL